MFLLINTFDLMCEILATKSNMILGRSLLNQKTENEQSNGIHQSVAMAIAGTSMFGIKNSSSDSYNFAQQVGIKCVETKSPLLVCSQPIFSH